MRYLEKILSWYLEEVNSPEPTTTTIHKHPTITPHMGGLYAFDYEGINVFAIIIGKEDQYYEVIKASRYIDLANQNDMLFTINGEQYIAETWNSFYLTLEELSSSLYIGKLLSEELQTIIDYRSGELAELPEDRRGLTVIEGLNTFPQNKFHAVEAKIVEKLAAPRLFDSL